MGRNFNYPPQAKTNVKLTVTYDDPQGGTMSSSFELPDQVTLAPDKLIEYGDALTEIVLGTLQSPEEPKGFFPMN